MSERVFDVAVVGAGPAGLMAALSAANYGASVIVFEKNNRSGRKLRITGKGRCNVTNNCTVQEFMEAVPENSKFLYSAANKFTPSDVMAFFEGLGVPLKTERGRRVFPVSDSAHDIANALERAATDAGVCIKYNSVVTDIITDGDDDGRSVIGIKIGGDEISVGAVIVATGGASYPGTGSTGDGYTFAKRLGICVKDPVPSLIPVITKEDTSDMSGLSLKNVTLTVKNKKGKVVFFELGEMLFTHFGLSGPLVLSASAHMREGVENYTMSIDLKPALDEKTLDQRLVSELSKYSVKDFANSLGDLLPRVLIPEIIWRSGIDPHKKSCNVTKEERRRLCGLLKDLSYTPKEFRSIDEAIITRGGIEVKELAPGTMAAKKIDGLYFAGEVINVDAYTGGYNLQIAFSTGKLAGEAAGMR